MADLVSELLSRIIPPPLFRILAGFSNLIYRLVLGASNDPTSWTSTLLPPLIALLAAYFSLLIAYRTVRSTVLLVWWGIKWGAIIGVGLAVWAWWTGQEDAIRSVGQAPGFFNSAGPILSALYNRGDQGNAEMNVDSLQSIADSIGLGPLLNSGGDDSAATNPTRHLRRFAPPWMNVLFDEFNAGDAADAQRQRRRSTRSASTAAGRRRRTRTPATTPEFDLDDDDVGTPQPRRATRSQTAANARRRRARWSATPRGDGSDSEDDEWRSLARLAKRYWSRAMEGA